jgi:hypothetical protein
MHNSAYNLLKQIKSAAAMGAGSFLPPEPLPNSVKANQIQQQELAAQQSEATAGAGNEQLIQMQKAQEDAVSQLQQTQQQLAQAQSELQNSQAQAQQQQQAIEMQAQQEIQKAQMDAQYELQSEKIKNQQQLLSVQEKYMRSAGKAKPDQNHILASQLKRVVRKVNGLKAASVTPTVGPRDSTTQRIDRNTQQSEKNFTGLPHSDIDPSRRTQQQWNDIAKAKRERYNNPQVKQKIEQEANAAQAAADKNRPAGSSNSLLGNVAGEVGSYWQDPKAYMKQNNPELNDSLLWDLTGGFTTNINSGFSNLARGNIGRGLMDLGYGYVGGISNIGLGLGAAGLGAKTLARLSSKALPAAAGNLTRFAGATKNVLPKSLQGWKANTAMTGVSLAPMFTGSDEAPQMDQAGDSSVDDYSNSGNSFGPGGVPYPGGFSAPQPQQRWDAGLSPSERFAVLNESIGKTAADITAGKVPTDEKVYPDIRKFMKNPPPPGEHIASPIPLLQAGFYQYGANKPERNHNSYGPIGDFIKQLIFQVGLPSIGLRNPLQPDFSKIYGNLRNNEAYNLPVNQSFNYY